MGSIPAKSVRGLASSHTLCGFLFCKKIGGDGKSLN
nr:MAG TPA: hypothetical protein [Caudoviricetes sp.]